VTAELRGHRAAHALRGLLLLPGDVLPEPVQVVLPVRNLERQQKERDDVEQEAGDMADPVVKPGELLPPPDPLVVAPLLDERRNDQQRSDRVRHDREKTLTRSGFSSPRNDSPKSFSSEFRIPNQKM
jgi:hypothetical protein